MHIQKSVMSESNSAANSFTNKNIEKKLSKLAGAIPVYYSGSQIQKIRVNKNKFKALEKQASKEDTTMYLIEEPNRDVKSVEELCNIIDGKYGTGVRRMTVQKYVRSVTVGESPMKKGPDGRVPKDTYRFLAGAFELYVRIHKQMEMM